MRGLSIEIPNRYCRYLNDILQDINMQKYIWGSGGEEAYYIEDNQPGVAPFPQPYICSGEDLYSRNSAKDYIISEHFLL